mgnify:CR=1 FL=1
MKKYLFFAASALALASCSSDDFVGDNSGNLHGTTNGEIAFAGGTAKITRANDHVGADAAKLLGEKFIVAGFKSATAPTTGVSATPVFDHYTVKWEANTAGTTADNTSDWKYVGLDPQTGLTTVKGPQTIKYWDYSTAQYDYIAFSTGTATIKTGTATATGDNEVHVTAVNPATATSSTDGAYTIQGTVNALNKCYIADLVTAYNPLVENKPKYQDEVTLSFRNLTTKVRVALYETIPGYSVKDVKFYSVGTGNNDETILETRATLFASGTEATDKFYGSGKATVYFKTVGKNKTDDSDYNKAHVTIEGSDESSSKNFGNLNYTTSDDTRLTGNDYLAQNTNKPTFAGKEADNYYQIALPNEAGTTLTLRVNYTLVANDKSGEEIKVYGAKAIIPAIYAQWKSNYAYTYIFKISDKTNGKTGINEGPEGLYPITFDAVVADSEEGNQSTITTVATPSITTYQKGHDITKNEYGKGDIYVMAMDKDGKLIPDLDKAVLYTVEDPNNVGISEATVHDALTIGASTTGSTTTGRNGIKLTEVTTNKETPTTIPGVDGNDITVAENTAVKFKATAGTYAFVYDITPTTAPAQTELHTAVTVAAGTDLTGKEYFNDEACTDLATGTTTTKKVYYQKITNTNRTYAIKVIKVVA